MGPLVAALALLVGLGAAGAWPARAAEPLVIGEINPRTGALALQGQSIHQGIVLAVEEQNARGGIGGRPVSLISRDDEGKPERALAAAEELTGRQRAVALIGGYVDSLVGPIGEVADRARVPYLATASLDERLTQRGNRHFFRISSLNAYVRVTTGIIQEIFKAERVAILYSQTPGASQLARRQKDLFERTGIRVVVFEPFSPGLSDFTPLLARVRDQRADVLLSDTFFADHLLLVRQMTQGGIRIRAFLGAFGMEFPNVIRDLGPASEGLYGTTSWQPGVTLGGRDADSRAFIDAYAKRFGSPPVPLSMHGYAAARALLAALEGLARRGMPISGESARDALAAVDLETPLGRVKFDERGEPLFYERVIVQIQDGRHVVVYPRERATAPAVHPGR
ncbi:MAG: ABC transporter substrate-binding protein [Candidatus Rokubacteria bacterium]|nr:ABC transporter substrate-binding protein [Candidatus Rokubacteria bacterium]